MSYKVFSTGEPAEWKRYLSLLSEDIQDVYYTPEYYRLYEDFGDGKARCFVYQSGGETAIYPFLLNSVNELGFELDRRYFDIQGAYGYNGVISSSIDSEFSEEFHSAFYEYCCEQNIIAGFTRFHPVLGNHLFSEAHMQIVFDRKTIYLNLENNSLDDIFKGFQNTTKKQIKKAINRYNIDVKVFNAQFDDYELIYDIYKESMQFLNADQYLFFNCEYFISLLKNVEHKLFVCYYDGTPVAMAIVLRGKRILHGHLVGVRLAFRQFSVYGLIYYYIIKYGIENNYRTFHVGGGTSGDPEDSLLKFKTNFSKTTFDFFIGKKIYNDSVYDNVVQQWLKKYPEKNEKYSKLLLKYRY